MSEQSDHGREHAPDAQPRDRSQAGGSTPLRGGPGVWLGKLLLRAGSRVWSLNGWRARAGMMLMKAGVALLKARRP